jgi:RNA polymerase sigma factor (sigma-70 family)
MAVGPSRGVWKQLDGLFRFGASGQLGDAELLGRFVAGRRDEAAEEAFAALVGRHGPMVLGVCRRVLGDRHEAEDAFQAVFLVLARKAGAIARREQLANWLHGVASRTALDALARADRRRTRERKASATAAEEVGPDDGPERVELRAILDEELARLPASYRGPLILCELDGLSRQAAAGRLGIPEGTLSSRLARAKDLLRHRLTRRGLAPSVVAIEIVTHEARAFLLPPTLAGSTIQAAARVAAGASLAEAVSASVFTLTQGALNAMFLTKIKGLAIGLAAAAVVTTGVGVMGQGMGTATGRAQKEQADRLGSVEQKLDRILHALGDGEVGTGRGTRNPDRWPSRPADPTVATTSADEPPTPTGPSPAGSARSGMMRGMMAAEAPIDERVADLERRLADLERRFGAMERRLSSSGSARPSGRQVRSADGNDFQGQNPPGAGQQGKPGSNQGQGVQQGNPSRSGGQGQFGTKNDRPS